MSFKRFYENRYGDEKGVEETPVAVSEKQEKSETKDYKSMSKDELDVYAEGLKISLDRRKSRKSMIADFEKALKS
tara:strand:- start:408 stop:632 length:225 start_codon:yes stop_codon:yes gene_type:complete